MQLSFKMQKKGGSTVRGTRGNGRTVCSLPSRKTSFNPKCLKGGPGQVTQLVGASHQGAEVAGSISGQGAYQKQPTNALPSETTRSMFLSLK